MPVLILVWIHDVVHSSDHSHTHIAREFFETKQRGAIGQPGKRRRVFAQMPSEIVVPQLGNIAEDRRSEDACAVQFGRKSPALRETFVKNRSLKRGLCLHWRRLATENAQVDERSGHRCRTDFHHKSAVDQPHCAALARTGGAPRRFSFLTNVLGSVPRGTSKVMPPPNISSQICWPQ